MRYPASEKLEIIRLVERSHLPVRRTLDKLSIPRSTFYDRYRAYAEAGLEDRASGPGRCLTSMTAQFRYGVRARKSSRQSPPAEQCVYRHPLSPRTGSSQSGD